MATILELRGKRANAWDAAKKFLDEHSGVGGVLSAEDAIQYDRMEKEVVDLGREIERRERAEALDREMAAPARNPIVGSIERPDEARTGCASDEYKRAFWNYAKTRPGAYNDATPLQVGTDGSGGYLVPDEFERTLIEKLEEENVFRRLAHRIATSSGDRKIPVVATKGTATWMDENAAYTESEDTFTQVTLSAYKLGTTVKISDELLYDSAFNMEQYIAKEIARRIGAAEETAFFTGDGSSKPTGIFAASGGADAGVTTASATKITSDEVIDLFYALGAPYRKNATWVFNDATIKEIRKLKTGDGAYLWQPAITAGTPDTLLNRPVVTAASVATIAASAKIGAFGDFSYYWIADRQSRSLKRLAELYAATGQVGFQASERVDGKLILSEAIKTLTMHA